MARVGDSRDRTPSSVFRILTAKGVRLSLCAPTGRATKRMTEATGFDAKTIHRLLEVDPKGGGFKTRQRQPARMRPAGRRRNLHGRRHADAGIDEGRAGSCRVVDCRRHRPAPLCRPRSNRFGQRIGNTSAHADHRRLVVSAGEWITAAGEWVNDRTHGQQFKSRFMRTSAPTTIRLLRLAGRPRSTARRAPRRKR
jgi:hypothetical protein